MTRGAASQKLATPRYDTGLTAKGKQQQQQQQRAIKGQCASDEGAQKTCAILHKQYLDTQLTCTVATAKLASLNRQRGSCLVRRVSKVAGGIARYRSISWVQVSPDTYPVDVCTSHACSSGSMERSGAKRWRLGGCFMDVYPCVFPAEPTEGNMDKTMRQLLPLLLVPNHGCLCIILLTQVVSKIGTWLLIFSYKGKRN